MTTTRLHLDPNAQVRLGDLLRGRIPTFHRDQDGGLYVQYDGLLMVRCPAHLARYVTRVAYVTRVKGVPLVEGVYKNLPGHPGTTAVVYTEPDVEGYCLEVRAKTLQPAFKLCTAVALGEVTLSTPQGRDRISGTLEMGSLTDLQQRGCLPRAEVYRTDFALGPRYGSTDLSRKIFRQQQLGRALRREPRTPFECVIIDEDHHAVLGGLWGRLGGLDAFTATPLYNRDERRGQN